MVPAIVEVNNGKNSWFVVKSLKTVEPAPVSPLPLPKKLVAVIIPEVLMLPVLPIPSPVSPLPSPKN